MGVVGILLKLPGGKSYRVIYQVGKRGGHGDNNNTIRGGQKITGRSSLVIRFQWGGEGEKHRPKGEHQTSQKGQWE